MHLHFDSEKKMTTSLLNRLSEMTGTYVFVYYIYAQTAGWLWLFVKSVQPVSFASHALSIYIYEVCMLVASYHTLRIH